MLGAIANSLKAKGVILLMLVAVIPLTGVGLLSYYNGRASLEEGMLHTLEAIRDIQTRVLREKIEDARDSAMFIADYDRVEMALAQLSASTVRSMAGLASGLPPVEESKEGTIYAQLARFAKSFLDLRGREGYEDVLVIRPNGEVIFTAKNLSDLGANLTGGELAGSGLRRAWERVVKTQQPAVVDFSMYAPSGGPALFVAVPVLTRAQRALCGVLVLRLGPQRINDPMKLPDSVGKTAETYLVGSDLTMRSQSRFGTESTLLKKRVDTESVKLSMQDKTGSHEIRDYRGVPVLSAYSHTGINEVKELGADFEWAILAEIDVDEAGIPAVTLARRVFIVGLVAALLAGLLAFLVARGLTNPILAVTEVAVKISRGDLTVNAPDLNRRDELGTLASAFRSMIESLRDQISRMAEGVQILSSASLEVSATAAQLAASSSQTLAAVAETTTTIEQVRQAARLVSERGKDLAGTAQRTVEVSATGKKASDGTITGISLAQNQMAAIGETVVKLKEHSQAIEDIIETVQDLANQSNLLAVNASIEAARAGDSGKGFSVVAHEIKALAEQSKTATGQIRSILEQTRQWVSAVVMATDQGAKAVEAGAAQSVMAGESIDSLAQSVLAASQAATVIEASSHQQNAGLDQVSGAMTSIQQAMRQITDGTSQLQTAAGRLGDLGGDLKELTEQYTV